MWFEVREVFWGCFDSQMRNNFTFLLNFLIVFLLFRDILLDLPHVHLNLSLLIDNLNFFALNFLENLEVVKFQQFPTHFFDFHINMHIDIFCLKTKTRNGKSATKKSETRNFFQTIKTRNMEIF